MRKLNVLLPTMLLCIAPFTAVSARCYPCDVVIGQRNTMQADREGGIRRLLAPGSATPKIGPDGTVLDYVRWAKQSLSMGNTAEAELSLEWGQLRRRVDEHENALAAGLPPATYDAQCERSLCKAMRSIGRGDAAAGARFIDVAIAEYVQEAKPQSDFADPFDGSHAASAALGIRSERTRLSLN